MNDITCNQTTLRYRRFTDVFAIDRQRSDESKDNNKCYEFGEYFYYSDMMKVDYHYCAAKYKTLKAELTQNIFESVSIKQWNKALTTAQSIFIEMESYCKDNSITQIQCFDKFGIRFYCKDYPYYNKRFNIKCQTKISVLHLMSVILYFNHSKLATMIRKTLRKWDKNETFNDIKQRHCHFVNICRCICETVTLYGNELEKDECIYRGVNNSLFEWLDACWNGPLSTTTDINVAKKFARPTGSVLKLSCSESGFLPMYIDGSKKLSKYLNEKEYLMWSPDLQIIDIPFSNNKYTNAYEWIAAIRLFQKLICGHLFNKKETQQLLNETVQNKLIKLIQFSNVETESETVMLNHSNMQFVQSLFDTTLHKLMAIKKIIWMNPIIYLQLNERIQRDIIQLQSKYTHIKCIQKCQIKEWIMKTEELRRLLSPWLINNVIKQYSGGINNEYITEKIAQFDGIEKVNNVQINHCCECNVYFQGTVHTIQVVILMTQSSNLITNEFYDIHILTYQYPSNINEKDNLMLSFDLLCDELNICLHFCSRKVSMYRQRSHTHIVSAKQIQTLIKHKQYIHWNVAFRYFYQ